MTTIHLRHGDCVEQLLTMKEGSVGGIVCDPPYGLEFMGAKWDGADGFRRSLNDADVSRDNAFGRASRTSPEYRAGHLFQEWCEAWAREALRVLKPGGHLLAFGGTRTSHRLACAVEDAGFVDVSLEAWNYGSGFPKSHDVSKGIDKAAGAEREAVGVRQLTGYGRANVVHGQQTRNTTEFVQTSDVPATDAAKAWQGWGTALKPSWEPVIVGRKP